jgi:hypothetical protein
MLMHKVLLIAVILAVWVGVMPAPTISAQTSCAFTPTVEGARLYHAPLTDPSQEIGALTVGMAYLVQRQHAEHYYVTLDGVTGGWVDRRSGMLSGACDAIPVDNTPLGDFPTVCTLTSTDTIPFYGDSALTEPRNALAAGTYVVTSQTSRAYLVRIDHAFGGWVPSSAGSLSGACDTLPPDASLTARALADARAWTVPNVKTGQIAATLAEGSSVVIVAGPVLGPIRLDTNDEGAWYQVYQTGQVVGWVWEARLDFADPPTPPPPAIQTAITQPNARLWTHPDVKSGSIRAYLPAGIRVTILTGPVTGPIRYDTSDLGEWYYVQPEGGFLPGWIWAGRLAWE